MEGIDKAVKESQAQEDKDAYNTMVNREPKGAIQAKTMKYFACNNPYGRINPTKHLNLNQMITQHEDPHLI